MSAFFLMERIPVTAMIVAAARHSMRSFCTNLPELCCQNTPFWNGLSFAQYDYMVRLYSSTSIPTPPALEPTQIQPIKRMAWVMPMVMAIRLLLKVPWCMRWSPSSVYQPRCNYDQDYAGVWGDLDNDSCLDLFLYGEYHPTNRLYKNDCMATAEITELSTITNDTLTQTCNGTLCTHPDRGVG